jgi:enoyl-CoA hydratase/carnithine racemase
LSWFHRHFPARQPASILDVNACFQEGSDEPVAVSFSEVEPAVSSDEESLEILQRISEYPGLVVVLFDGKAEAWFPGLVAIADMTIATSDSSLSLNQIGEQTAGFTAAKISQQIGRARTMQILVDGGITVRRLHQYGLVGRLAEKEEISAPSSLLEELLTGVALSAAGRLKTAWKRQEGSNIDRALAVERLEFQRCFSEGAAGDIADYLERRKNN